MMDRIVYCKQGEEEWFAVKLGKVSASHIHEVLAKGSGITREKYLVRLLKERLTGVREDSFSSKSLDRGVEEEPAARLRYESENFVVVEEIGFVHHEKIAMMGCSPDGLCGDDGLVEIKNRDSVNHIKWFENPTAKPDRTALLQMQGQLACTGRKYVDYVHYDSRWPAKLQYHCQRIMRDEKVIVEIEHGVGLFLEELNERHERLKAKL